jgi:GNAT superfamily N-acetyltransferase
MIEVREFYIRPATASDVATLTDLSARTFVSAYRALLPEQALLEFVASAFSLENIKEEINAPGSHFLLAYEGERPVGYALLREAGLPVGLTGRKPGELARIYLEEQVTGKGYGSKLMETCIDAAQRAGHDQLWLGVWERNERAIRFYEKKGFTRAGTLPFEFGGDLHTDLVMARSIG